MNDLPPLPFSREAIEIAAAMMTIIIVIGPAMNPVSRWHRWLTTIVLGMAIFSLARNVALLILTHG